MKPLATAAFLCIANAPLLAGVITVDDSGGADFLDLPEAVAAASPGDTLLVHPGTYSAFAIDTKPLTVLGLAAGQVQVLGESLVYSVAAQTMVVLCRLDFEHLTLSSCTGPVVLDELRIHGEGTPILRIEGCADVRTIGLQLESPFKAKYVADFSAALVQDFSRFEVVESLLVGNQITPDDYYGWHALRVRSWSRAYLAASSATGGKGGDNHCFFVCCKGYLGGHGVRVEESSSLRVAGQASDVIQSGKTGSMWCGGVPTKTCSISAYGAGAVATWSGVTLVGVICIEAGGSVRPAATPDPVLERGLPPMTGSPASFHVTGQPGDLVTLFVGRSAVVVPLPGVEVERLTSEERQFDLGTIGPSGTVSSSLPMPPAFPQGFAFFGQARILRSGAELRTNSVPVVLR
jgi:hypothetical protein